MNESGVSGVIKYSVAGATSLGVSSLPFDVTLAMAMALGLFSGTCLAWGYAGWRGRKLRKDWLLIQLATYPAFMVLVLWQAETWGWTNKAIAGVLCIASFLSYEAVARLKPKMLKKIDDSEL